MNTSWQMLKLGDSLDLLIDNRGKNPPYVESGIPCISGMSVTDNGLDFSKARYIDEKTWLGWMPQPLQTNDVILTSEAPLGRPALVRTDERIALAQRVYGLRGKKGVLDSRFLYYSLFTRGVQADLLGRATGTTVVGIRQPALKDIKIPSPSFAEQQAIAEVLGALDDKIDINNKIALTIEELGSARFKRLGLDVEPSHDAIHLDSLFDLNPRRVVVSNTPTLIDMHALPTTTPLINIWKTGIRKGGTRFANGDTLLARITPCLENRKTAFVDFLLDGEVGIGSTEFIVLRTKNDLPLGLSYFMATSERFREFAIQHLVGTSGRQRVSASDLTRHTLCPIDHSELQSFGEWADLNLELAGGLRNENQTLATIRDALLPQLMSGKLRVKDVEVIVESVV